MHNWPIKILTYLILLFGPQVQAQSPDDIVAAEKGTTSEGGRAAGWYFDQHQRLAGAIDGLKPQTPGKVDTYILVVGLDRDPVFQTESEETAAVLQRRYGAEGRTLTLITGSETGYAQGSPANIQIALAAIAKKMDVAEDVLILYTTSHGAPKIGIVYQDGRKGSGTIAPRRMRTILNDVGIKRRIIVISACYSGEFVPFLANDDSIVITAASAMRSSFGCAPGNDWTFFGDALINHGLRTLKPLPAAASEAVALIDQWEKRFEFVSSQPQISVGAASHIWLNEIEKNIPEKPTEKTGTPAIKSEGMAELEAEIAAKNRRTKAK